MKLILASAVSAREFVNPLYTRAPIDGNEGGSDEHPFRIRSALYWVVHPLRWSLPALRQLRRP